VATQLACAGDRSLRSTGRRQLAQALHARGSVLTALQLVMLGVELQVWDGAEARPAFARKTLGFAGTLQGLCEAGRWAEACQRADAFFATKAAKHLYDRF
jgi:hypothetical protein